MCCLKGLETDQRWLGAVRIRQEVFLSADEGEIYFEGKKVKISSPRDAMRLGIETVYQEQALAPEMSVARNTFMGREPVRSLVLLDKKKMRRKSMETLRDIGLHVKSPDISVKFLSGGERQGVAIARVMHFKAKLLIMDEPTMALSVKDVQQVLQFVKQLKAQGISCVIITHNLYHVHPVADRFVILSHGRKVGDVRKEDASIDKLDELIVAGYSKNDKLCTIYFLDSTKSRRKHERGDFRKD